MPSVLLTLVVFLKFLIPPLMLIWPFYGLWGNYFLDVVDGDVLQSLGMRESLYQTLDKSADLISYIFMFILGSRWRIKKTVALLFAYRMIGQVLFFTTGKEIIFFYFQNFLEPLMMIYALLLFRKKSEEKAYMVYKKHIIFVWGIILAYKVWNEWSLHFANIDLSLFLFGFTGGQ